MYFLSLLDYLTLNCQNIRNLKLAWLIPYITFSKNNISLTRCEDSFSLVLDEAKLPKNTDNKQVTEWYHFYFAGYNKKMYL